MSKPFRTVAANAATVTLSDPFFLVLGDTGRYIAKFPNCDFMLADMNQDGFVNGADIDFFFACLGWGVCP